MIDNKKLIALCTSRVFDPQVHSFIEKLNEELKIKGCYLWIYAINADLYWEDDADESETTVFDIIDWDYTDAVVIMDEKIKSYAVSQRIIDRAHDNKVPIVVVDGRYEETTSINFDYARGFEELVRHVIFDHRPKDPHIMAGFKGNKFSDERIEVFKKVIEEYGIEFNEDRVSYGEFWSRPARAAAHELLLRDKLPDAVICANDIMAINVCDVFKNAGIRIPEDVVITGFDGYDEAFISVPAITTASCMTPDLAEITCRAVIDCIDGKGIDNYPVVPRVIRNESCGCPRCAEKANSVRSFNTGFYRYQDDIRRQHTVSARMQSSRNPNELIEVLKDYYMPEVSIIVHNDCFRSDINYFAEGTHSDKFCFLYNSEKQDRPVRPFDPKINSPEYLEVIRSGYPLIYNSLDYMNKTMGFIRYSYKTYDLTEYSKTAGISNMISVGLGGYINLQYQQYLISKVEEMYQTDQLTGLYNRTAFHESFDAMKNDPDNNGMTLTVIMADLDGLKKINDTYGHDAGDRAIAAIASALKEACPANALCVRFGGDEMVSFIPGEVQSDGIISKIDDILANNCSGFKCPISASCGVYVTKLTPETDVEQIIKFADEKMYMVKKERRGDT